MVCGMSLRRVVAALATLCLVLAGGVAEAGQLHSADAAAAQADADLALLQLPAGATPVGGSPNAALAQPAEIAAIDTLVDHPLWWTVPGTRDGVLAYVAAHPPQGFDPFLTIGGSNQVKTLGFGSSGLGSDETLLVSAIQDGDHVDVRADAQVVWYPAKTPAETIPPSVTTATFGYLGPMPGSFPDTSTTPKPRHANRVLTGKVLRRVVADLNALQTVATGESSCPPDDGELGRIHVVSGGRHLVFTIRFSGCEGVEVSAGGHPQPALGISQKLIADVYATIGVRFTPIPVTAPQGPPPHVPAPSLTLAHNKVQAQRYGDAVLHAQAAVPGGANWLNSVKRPTRAPYNGHGTVVDRTYFYTVQGTMAELVNWYIAQLPKGFVLSEPGKPVHGVRRLVVEPRDRTVHPAALLWLSMVQSGKQVVFRLDGQAAWAPKT
jgi:hypothetical protein